MKFHCIGHLAICTRHVEPTDILAAAGFNLTKKIFIDKGKIGNTYYQAETAAEDRELRLQFRSRPSEVFHLQAKKQDPDPEMQRAYR